MKKMMIKMGILLIVFLVIIILHSVVEATVVAKEVKNALIQKEVVYTYNTDFVLEDNLACDVIQYPREEYTRNISYFFCRSYLMKSRDDVIKAKVIPICALHRGTKKKVFLSFSWEKFESDGTHIHGSGFTPTIITYEKENDVWVIQDIACSPVGWIQFLRYHGIW